MPPKIEKLFDGLQIGEGPHWDVESQSLYFVDSSKGTICRYVPATKQLSEAALVGGIVSIIIPIEEQKDAFVVTTDRKLVEVTWDGVSDEVSNIEILGEVEDDPETQHNRFNDGKADPVGRLWVGTLSRHDKALKFTPELGNLYSYEKRKGFTQHVDKVTISNGLAWNKELKKFYYIDSLAYKVFEYDYEENNGTISNSKVIFTLENHNIPGIPDGQTIDTDGNLWIAIFGGGRVIKIDPRKPETLLETIYFPAKQITSVAFGGPDLDELYVTSANIPSTKDYEVGLEGGSLYRVSGVGAKGYPGLKVKL